MTGKDEGPTNDPNKVDAIKLSLMLADLATTAPPLPQQQG